MEDGRDDVVDSELCTDDHGADGTGERRIRHQTEKGLAYTEQLLSDHQSRSWRAVSRKIDDLSSLMKNDNVAGVKDGQSDFQKVCAEFDKSQQAYRECLNSQEEFVQYDEFCSQADKTMVDFKTELIYWLRCHEAGSASLKSAVSVSSSKRSSASQQVMQQKAKLAALEEKRKFAAKEVEL